MRALLALALLFALAWAEQVPTHDFFRITQTTSRSTSTPGAWRYVIAPRTKEARSYWGVLVADWVRSLKIGIPVRFGPYRLEFEKKRILLQKGCDRFHPRCYSRPALPQGLESWKLDLILIDFHNALTWTLADAQKHARPYPATVAVSKLLRFHVDKGGVFLAEPLGWKP